jgi:iron complex transport system permease protein
LAVLVMGTAFLSIAWGPTGFVPRRAMAVLLGAATDQMDAASTRDWLIVMDIRLPRTLLALLVGAGLAVSGALLQGLFRNPLADPGLVGISAGASLGAVLVIVLTGGATVGTISSIYMLPLAAFACALATIVILYATATRQGRTSIATMLLAGLAIAALANALVGFAIALSNDQQLRDFTFWSLGSLAGATWPKVAIMTGCAIVLAPVLPRMAGGLDALLLGEAEAQHLGFRVQRLKRLVVLAVAMAVGAATAVAGPIGFVGIVVPHLLRLVIGSRHRGLLLASALLGGALLVCADMIARIVVAPAELPIGIVTAIIGAPFFLWLLLRQRSRLDI